MSENKSLRGLHPENVLKENTGLLSKKIKRSNLTSSKEKVIKKGVDFVPSMAKSYEYNPENGTYKEIQTKSQIPILGSSLQLFKSIKNSNIDSELKMRNKEIKDSVFQDENFDASQHYNDIFSAKKDIYKTKSIIDMQNPENEPPFFPNYGEYFNFNFFTNQDVSINNQTAEKKTFFMATKSTISLRNILDTTSGMSIGNSSVNLLLSLFNVGIQPNLEFAPTEDEIDAYLSLWGYSITNPDIELLKKIKDATNINFTKWQCYDILVWGIGIGCPKKMVNVLTDLDISGGLNYEIVKINILNKLPITDEIEKKATAKMKFAITKTLISDYYDHFLAISNSIINLINGGITPETQHILNDIISTIITGAIKVRTYEQFDEFKNKLSEYITKQIQRFGGKSTIKEKEAKHFYSNAFSTEDISSYTEDVITNKIAYKLTSRNIKNASEIVYLILRLNDLEYDLTQMKQDIDLVESLPAQSKLIYRGLVIHFKQEIDNINTKNIELLSKNINYCLSTSFNNISFTTSESFKKSLITHINKTGLLIETESDLVHKLFNTSISQEIDEILRKAQEIKAKKQIIEVPEQRPVVLEEPEKEKEEIGDDYIVYDIKFENVYNYVNIFISNLNFKSLSQSEKDLLDKTKTLIKKSKTKLIDEFSTEVSNIGSFFDNELGAKIFKKNENDTLQMILVPGLGRFYNLEIIKPRYTLMGNASAEFDNNLMKNVKLFYETGHNIKLLDSTDEGLVELNKYFYTWCADLSINYNIMQIVFNISSLQRGGSIKMFYFEITKGTKSYLSIKKEDKLETTFKDILINKTPVYSGVSKLYIIGTNALKTDFDFLLNLEIADVNYFLASEMHTKWTDNITFIASHNALFEFKGDFFIKHSYMASNFESCSYANKKDMILKLHEDNKMKPHVKRYIICAMGMLTRDESGNIDFGFFLEVQIGPTSYKIPFHKTNDYNFFEEFNKLLTTESIIQKENPKSDFKLHLGSHIHKEILVLNEKKILDLESFVTSLKELIDQLKLT